MHKFKHGKLKSGGSGKTVKNRKQAIAIMMSEKRNESKHGGKYTSKSDKAKKGSHRGKITHASKLQRG
jgi:Family of unknown function (DUF6496)